MAERQDIAKTTVIVDGKQGINTLGKLELEANDLKKSLKGMKKGTDEYVAATERMKKLDSLIDRQRNKLGLTGMTLAQLTRQQRQLRNEIRNTATKGTKEYIRLEKQYKKVTAEVNRQNSALRASGKRMGAVGQSIKTMVGAYVGIFAVVGVITNISKKIAGFQQESANLAAVLGKTRGEIVELTKDARRLGSTTAFTSQEVVQLQTAFAKLGFSEQEILNLSEATLDLAAATGTDLATAAEVAGATVKGFELDAAETQRVVDVMAKSFSSSALDMEKFSTAMSTVAPVAKAADVSLERTTSLLGLLVDRGLDASTAGTSLRNVFLTLSEKGLTFEQAMAKINTASDKNAVSLELFGKRGATTATILANTATQAQELEEKLLSSGGAAEAMADEQLDTLTGSLTKLSSAWDGFILSLEDGEGIIGTTTRFVVDLMTNTLNGLRSLKGIIEETKGKEDRRVKANDVDEFKKFTEAMNERGVTFNNLKEASEAFLKVDKERLKQLQISGSWDEESTERQKRQIEFLEKRIENIQKFATESEEAAEMQTIIEAENEARLKNSIENQKVALERAKNEKVEIIRQEFLHREITADEMEAKLQQNQLNFLKQSLEIARQGGEDITKLQQDINNKEFEIAKNNLSTEGLTPEDKARIDSKRKLVEMLNTFAEEQAIQEELGKLEDEERARAEEQLRIERKFEKMREEAGLTRELESELSKEDRELLAQLKEAEQMEIDMVNERWDDIELERDRAHKEELLANEEEFKQRLIEAEMNYQQAKAAALYTGLGVMSDIFGQQTALGKALFAFEKGAAIADIIVNTSRAIAGIKASIGLANAKAIATMPLTAGMPWVAINSAIGAKQIATAKLGAAAQIGTIVSSAIQQSGAGGGGGQVGQRGGRRGRGFYEGGDTGAGNPQDRDAFGNIAARRGNDRIHGNELVIPSFERNDPRVLNVEALLASRNPNFRSNINPAAVPGNGMSEEQANELISTQKMLLAEFSKFPRQLKSHVILQEYEMRRNELDEARGRGL